MKQRALDGPFVFCYNTNMGRLDDIKWRTIQQQLYRDIMDCPLAARKDLIKMYNNLEPIATDVSKLEVVERRTMGSSGRSANEKLSELEKQIKYLEKMITIARLSF